MSDSIELREIFLFCFFLVLHAAEHQVCQDAEDQSACNGSQGDFAEADGQTADTRDQDNGDDEEVAVVVEVNLLDHLQTGDCDETVQSDADAAHDAAGDCGEEGCKRSDEADHDRHDRSGQDRNDGSVAGNCDAADGLAVSGVRAAGEKSACDGAYAVTEKSAMETGLFCEVGSDDGRQVLVVGDVLSKDNECHRDVGYSDGCDVPEIQFLDTFERLNKCEVGNPFDVCEFGEVDYLESIVAGYKAENGEQGRYKVTCEDSDDEGNHLQHLLAEEGAEHRDSQSDETADDADISGSSGGVAGQIADGIACQRKSDDCDGRSDDNCRHELIDPFDADCFDDDCQNHIDETREGRADDQTCVTGLCGNGTGKRCEHGAEESEGASKEDRAGELGKEQVDQRADACTEQSRSLAHAVADD